MKLFTITFLICVFSFSTSPLLCQEDDDTLLTIKIKSPCRCKIDKIDSVGDGEIFADIILMDGLQWSDFDCYGVKLYKGDSAIACLRNTDSTIFLFKNLSTGAFRLQFWADGYYTTNKAVEIRKKANKKTDTFYVHHKDLPLWLSTRIKEKRKEKKHKK